MKKIKVMTVGGTLPKIFWLSVFISNLESSEAIDHFVIYTGQSYGYELNEYQLCELAV